ncbi:MAG TPA: Rrf2 family transcriptional regulator [Longimicrobiaceae bacterium]|jgi:DNA-binding IscR family transcriptional regulator|nr:Rrf2 family transcriptional regulator [Longimicrobiaceae bacterium]
MTTSSRFAVAVHVLTLLEMSGGVPVTSEYAAGSVNTNAAVVRRILSMLAKAGLTRSQMGTGGGALLARPADEITLLDVHRAVDDGELFGLHREPPNPACPVGRNIQGALEVEMDAAARALEERLAVQTIAGIVHDVTRRERERSTGTA